MRSPLPALGPRSRGRALWTVARPVRGRGTACHRIRPTSLSSRSTAPNPKTRVRSNPQTRVRSPSSDFLSREAATDASLGRQPQDTEPPSTTQPHRGDRLPEREQSPRTSLGRKRGRTSTMMHARSQSSPSMLLTADVGHPDRRHPLMNGIGGLARLHQAPQEVVPRSLRPVRTRLPR